MVRRNRSPGCPAMRNRATQGKERRRGNILTPLSYAGLAKDGNSQAEF